MYLDLYEDTEQSNCRKHTKTILGVADFFSFWFGFAILTGGAVHEKGLIAQDCKF